MKRTIALAAIALAGLTACNPLDPPARFAPVQVDVGEAPVPASNHTNAEGGVCLSEPCDPPPNDTPNIAVGGLELGECDTPGEGGCPTPETTIPAATTTTPCREGEGGAPAGGC